MTNDTLSDIVNVTITRETEAVSQAGFGIPMILSLHKHNNDRIRYYATLDDIVSDGFASTTPEYIAAAAMFGQSPSPTQIAIGRRSVDSAEITVTTVDDAHLYTVTINGTAITYQAQTSDTGTLIASGIAAAINASAEPVTATPSTNTVVIAADVANTAYTLAVDADLTISAYVGSDSVGNDLTAINVANADWYALVMISRVSADVQAAALWIEANVKIFGTASADANIYDSGSTTDIAYILKNAGYTRTFVMYHASAATTYPEAAWIAKMLPTDPGAVNWAFKTLGGVSASSLTATQRAAVLAKKANTYETRGGVNITKNGTMASGEYIDIIIGIDWLTSQIKTNVYSGLVRIPKIPYTNGGLVTIKGYIMQALSLAVARGVLSSDVKPTVTMPLLANISDNDKAARTLSDVKFTGVLAGAINAVSIQGYITV